MICPRCGGFLTKESDHLTTDRVCINCGYREPLTGYDRTSTPPPRQTPHSRQRLTPHEKRERNRLRLKLWRAQRRTTPHP